MLLLLYKLAIVIATSVIVSNSMAVEEDCRLQVTNSSEVSLYFKSKRNETGKWRTTFVVQTDTRNKSLDEGMVLDLKQSVIHCGDKEILQLRGVLEQDTKPKQIMKGDPLFFEKGGDNTEFSNDRRTVTRKSGDSDPSKGSAITNRPLKDNELMEVKIDKLTTKWNNAIMIGVTTLTPTEIMFQNNILQIKTGTLVYYYESIYHNGTIVQSNYGAKLHTLKVGDRVGVMRKEGDTAHFYVNGADQGAVKQKFNGTVYGIVEMYYGAVQATIVNPK